MVKQKEEKSDDIEIVSIGKLYIGPWDKKYWSSSRGKDRYPYPIGYKSVRTQNGVTYKMEILEGHNGPSFTINSSDGKSCSGETPDIAWDSFQKKSSSGLKLWHGKRFSCKIGGIEFFGFKNPFVQRLLRELVANVGGSAEQNSVNSNFSSCEVTVNKFQGESSPDLGTARITGKRSRDNGVAKTTRKTRVKPSKDEKATKNSSASNSMQTDKSEDRSGVSSISATANRVSEFCSSEILEQGNMAAAEELEKPLTVTKMGMQLDSLDISRHLKKATSVPQEQGETIKSSQSVVLEADNLLRNQIRTDRSLSIEVRGSISEEKDAVPNIHHGMQTISDADLCVPDSMEHIVDGCCSTSPRKHIPADMKDVPNNVSNSEASVINSHPEDGIDPFTSSTFSEKYDTNLDGQEVAKSMMTVLLPRALPLLKTFNRKKKKSANPSKKSNRRYEEDTNISNICIRDASREGALPEHSKLQRQKEEILPEHLELERQKEEAYIPCGARHSVVLTFNNTEPVVPDSFDSFEAEDLILPAAKSNQISSDLDTDAQLPMSVIGEKSSHVSYHETGEHDLNLQCQPQCVSHENSQKDNILAPEKEIIANSTKSGRHGHSMDELPTLQASTVKCFPGADSINSRNSVNLNFQEQSEASPGNKMPKDGDSNHLLSNSDQKTLDFLELSACYVFPMPISMVEVIVKENDIYICVQCGYLEHKESTLLAYKASRKGENLGPSLIGHVPMALQSSTNALSCDIIGDNSMLQFTPHAQSFVIHNIKVPYCREGKLDCICAACTSDCFEKNTIKIVQLNSGYVSLVTRLEITQDVCCFLVCAPNFLLAAEESGKMKLWVMNSGWSAEKERYYLPTLDCIFPCLVELKRIPQSSGLVVGHNGIGEFGLWDIENRSLLSRFSSPGMSVFHCIPAGVFKWQGKREQKMEEHIDEILDATKVCFTRKSKNDAFSAESNDVAVWLLISTSPDPYSQHHHNQLSEKKAKRVRCWKLALLANNVVISGSAIDSGAAAVTSLGHGIMGRSDGLVYLWEMSTGVKLGNLKSFKDTEVSCIASDPTNSDALAIAGGSQLLVYVPS